MANEKTTEQEHSAILTKLWDECREWTPSNTPWLSQKKIGRWKIFSFKRTPEIPRFDRVLYEGIKFPKLRNISYGTPIDKIVCEGQPMTRLIMCQIYVILKGLNND